MARPLTGGPSVPPLPLLDIVSSCLSGLDFASDRYGAAFSVVFGGDAVALDEKGIGITRLFGILHIARDLVLVRRCLCALFG